MSPTGSANVRALREIFEYSDVVSHLHAHQSTLVISSLIRKLPVNRPDPAESRRSAPRSARRLSSRLVKKRQRQIGHTLKSVSMLRGNSRGARCPSRSTSDIGSCAHKLRVPCIPLHGPTILSRQVWGGEHIHVGLYTSLEGDDAKLEGVPRITRASDLCTQMLLAKGFSPEGPRPDECTVMDLGAGYGGSAREAAKQFGCKVRLKRKSTAKRFLYKARCSAWRPPEYMCTLVKTMPASYRVCWTGFGPCLAFACVIGRDIRNPGCFAGSLV